MVYIYSGIENVEELFYILQDKKRTKHEKLRESFSVAVCKTAAKSCFVERNIVDILKL